MIIHCVWCGKEIINGPINTLMGSIMHSECRESYYQEINKIYDEENGRFRSIPQKTVVKRFPNVKI